MSDFDSGDRTLPPTERRRREARKRGDIARSSQLSSAVILLAASCLFWFTTPLTLDPVHRFLHKGLSSIQSTSLSVNSTMEMLRSAGAVFVSALLPVGVLLLISGLIANLTQVGWLWIPSAIVPRFRGPGWNFEHRLGEIAGLILRITLLGCVTWRFMKLHEWPLHSFSHNEPALMLTQLVRMLAEFCLQLSGCLVLLGLVDYGYRFWRYEQSLKMTIDELRQEQRENSINSQIRNRQGLPITLTEIDPVGVTHES